MTFMEAMETKYEATTKFDTEGMYLFFQRAAKLEAAINTAVDIAMEKIHHEVHGYNGDDDEEEVLMHHELDPRISEEVAMYQRFADEWHAMNLAIGTFGLRQAYMAWKRDHEYERPELSECWYDDFVKRFDETGEVGLLDDVGIPPYKGAEK